MVKTKYRVRMSFYTLHTSTYSMETLHNASIFHGIILNSTCKLDFYGVCMWWCLHAWWLRRDTCTAKWGSVRHNTLRLVCLLISSVYLLYFFYLLTQILKENFIPWIPKGIKVCSNLFVYGRSTESHPILTLFPRINNFQRPLKEISRNTIEKRYLLLSTQPNSPSLTLCRADATSVTSNVSVTTISKLCRSWNGYWFSNAIAPVYLNYTLYAEWKYYIITSIANSNKRPMGHVAHLSHIG
jgi:hypothetical protein